MKIQNLDIPFNCRFTCWFCGEGSDQTILVTLVTQQVVNMPICDECKSYRCHSHVNPLAKLEKRIKEKMVIRNAKALSIGANWTKQELQESELTGSAFDGFKKSGWKMYLIAKARVNYSGWALSVDGIPLDDVIIDEAFEFDGLTFSSFESMLTYLSTTFALNEDFLAQVLALYGNNRAISAVKFCRLVPNNSRFQREKALKDLIESIKEKESLKS